MENQKKKSMKRKLRRELSGLLFAAPWLIGFIAFSMVPIILSIYYSLCSYNLFTEPVFVGLVNYKSLFSDRLFWKSVYNTLIFTLMFVPAQILLSICVAALLNFNIRGQWFFRTVFYVPSILPVVAATILWRWIYNYEYGLVNNLLNMLHLPSVLWMQDPQWTKPALTAWGFGAAETYLLFFWRQ